MNNLLATVTDTHRGILLIIIGVILLLHTLGFIVRGLNIIIIICSFAMILSGIFLISRQSMVRAYYKKMLAGIKKEEQKK